MFSYPLKPQTYFTGTCRVLTIWAYEEQVRSGPESHTPPSRYSQRCECRSWLHLASFSLSPSHFPFPIMYSPCTATDNSYGNVFCIVFCIPLFFFFSLYLSPTAVLLEAFDSYNGCFQRSKIRVIGSL